MTSSKPSRFFPSVSITQRVVRRFEIARMDRASRKLASLKPHQRAEFEKFAAAFLTKYAPIRNADLRPWVTPNWEGANAEFESLLTPIPPYEFLRSHEAVFHMFTAKTGADARGQLQFVVRHAGEDAARKLLLEDDVGKPLLANPGYLTSHQTTRQVYHLLRYQTTVGKAPWTHNKILEWGGGHGNMAKLVSRAASGRLTYVVVDTPIISSLQWLYLSTTLGPHAVHIVTRPGEPIQSGKVNLIPVHLVDELRFDPDLMISTFALSESSAASVEYVVKKDWFGAKHLLLAYSPTNSLPLPASGDLAVAARKAGGTTEDVGFGPKCEYAFR